MAGPLLAGILAGAAGSVSPAALLRLVRQPGRRPGRSYDDACCIRTRGPGRRVPHPRAVGADPDPDLRRAAIWLLGYVPAEADLSLLTHGAGDLDEQVRNVVVGAFARHGTSPETVDLMLSLSADPSAHVRVCVLSSLGLLQQRRTLPDVCRLMDDSSPHVRTWAAIALGRFHIKSAVRSGR